MLNHTIMQALLSLLNTLETKIPYHEKINVSVSQSSVGWHIEHSLLAAIRIIAVLKKSNPDEYKWIFNFPRLYVYTLNKIPRGRGKAPQSVQPAGEITRQTLTDSLAVAKQKVAELHSLHPRSNFMHPYFGKLNVKATIKFLKIHTQHHLKIIDDIVADR
jgi:hypothetical protein